MLDNMETRFSRAVVFDPEYIPGYMGEEVGMNTLLAAAA